MVLLYACSLLGLSFLFKKNKFVYVLLIVFAFIMTVYANKIPDLELYKSNYLIGGKISEPLYVQGVLLFRRLGFDYIFYRGVLCALALVIITLSLWEVSPYPNVVMGLYLVYPLCYDAVQIRTFVANAFVIFSVKFIYKFWGNRKLSNILWFVACILIGTGFHYSAILFLLLCCCFFDMKRNSLVFWVIIPCGLIVFLLLFAKLMPLIKITMSNANRMEHFITGHNEKSFLGLMGLFVPRSLIAAIIIVTLKLRKSKEYKLLKLKRILSPFFSFTETENSDDQIFIRNLLTGIMYIFMFTILEITVAEDYERLIRVAIVLFVIVMTRLLNRLEQGGKVSMLLFMYVFQMFFLLVTLRSMNDFETVFIPFLIYNQIL